MIDDWTWPDDGRKEEEGTFEEGAAGQRLRGEPVQVSIGKCWLVVDLGNKPLPGRAKSLGP